MKGLKKHTNGLPPWTELSNKVGNKFNDFNIVRGWQYIDIGKNFWLGYFCLIDGSGRLEIGDNVSLSSGVHIYTHDTSEYRALELEKGKYGEHVKRAPVKIGNNVQIGANSVVLPGVTIGNNVIIGALSLVNKDIPSNSVAVGNPCRVIKEI